MPPTTNKGKRHGEEPNETAKAHFTPLEDAAHATQNVWRLPHASSFLHLKTIN
jgi:hypothetical protein